MVRAMRKGPGLLAFAALAVGAGLACRGEKTAVVAPPPSSAASVESSDAGARTKRAPGQARPVIWIGLDGLDFELVDRLAAAGAMPNWKRLASEGYSAKLASQLPLLSPILWTTQATGVTPDVHRVLDFQEVDPTSGRKVPISGNSRSVPAVWNLASAAGRKVGVVGWWASHPAEEVNGFFVSDHASPILFDALPLEGATYPAALSAGVAQVSARDGRVAAADLVPFLQMLPSEIAAALGSGGGMENPVVALSRVLAATRVTQRIARDLYDRNLPDLTAVYFEGTDEVGHVFASYTPPRPACSTVRDADAARYERVVAAYYGVVDRILGQWMRRAEEDGAALVVTSDHGFKWGDDRPCGFASGNWSTAAFWHRPEGVFAAWGPGVAPGVSGARPTVSILDVAPTILGLLGVPADPRMPGAPVRAAFPGMAVAPRAAAASDLVVRRVAAAAPSAAESSEYAKKLLALGYLSPGEAQPLAPRGGATPGMTEGAWNNLGVYLRENRQDFPAAQAAFEKSLALRPDYYSPMFNLAVLYRAKGDTARARDWFLRSLAAVEADPAPAVAGWAHEYEKDGKAAAAGALLDGAAKRFPENEAIARERALFLHRAKDCRGALAALTRFEATTSAPETLNDLALFETCLAHREAVERLLTRSLALKPDQPQVARLLDVVRAAGRP
jgi:predicted AlkP superfamily phosphohydrolase/phosphomutase/Flp pilus assembly protein TadD